MPSTLHAASCLEWDQLVPMSEDELAEIGPAMLHLICGKGLPGSENLRIRRCFRQVRAMAKHVARETKLQRSQFYRHRERFNHSKARFKMVVLTTVLQRDFGIRAVPDSSALDYSDSRNSFFHGVLEGHPGCCATVPFLFAAVGHLLNYPLYFVQCPRHMFLRWVGQDGEEFNIETTSRGFVTRPDSYYWDWPVPRTRHSFQSSDTYFFRPLTMRELLSGTLIQRACCFDENRLYREAVEAACWSWELAPHHKLHESSVRKYLSKWELDLGQRWPLPRSPMSVNKYCPMFSSIPDLLEKPMRYLAICEEVLRLSESNDMHPRTKRQSARPGMSIILQPRVVIDFDEPMPVEAGKPKRVRRL